MHLTSFFIYQKQWSVDKICMTFVLYDLEQWNLKPNWNERCILKLYSQSSE